MVRWFEKVRHSWRLQRQAQWRRLKFKGQLGAPLVHYHLSAQNYQPRLDRQRRWRQRHPLRGRGGGSPLLAHPAAAYGPALPLNTYRKPLARGRPSRLRRWTAPRPVRRQKGRFIWNPRKGPLVSLARARKREFKQLKRRVSVQLRRVLNRPKRRRIFPTLLPQAGQPGISRERLRLWRRATQNGQRRW
jgi:hypothetical protein